MSSGLLDSRSQMATLDKENILSSIEMLGKQIEDTWQGMKRIEINLSPNSIKNIIWVGMGGSALGAWVGKYLYKLSLAFPFEIINHYQLPAYADENSLIILSSYSGNTEEVIQASQVALKRSKNIFVITAGGHLAEIAKKYKLNHYLIQPKYNPSNQPRMAIGYAITVLLGLFKRLGLIKLDDSQILTTIKFLEEKNKLLQPESKENNLAKLLAYAAYQRIIVLISADHLRGGLHVFNNQVNENAKNLTIELAVPEMNHHYLEALSFPKQLKDDLVFFIINSKLFLTRIQQRLELTNQLIDRAGYPHEFITLQADDSLSQVFELIQLGSYLSFYLAMLNGINPAPIPNVAFLKEHLKKLKSHL